MNRDLDGVVGGTVEIPLDAAYEAAGLKMSKELAGWSRVSSSQANRDAARPRNEMRPKAVL